MTAVLEVPPPAQAPDPEDTPRKLDQTRGLSDRVFRSGVTGVGAVVLVVTCGIGFFLGLQMLKTYHRYGIHFFTENQWIPNRDILGVAQAMIGTVEVALVAMVFSFPLAILTALYISEYAPSRIKPALVAMVDLMAAIPSIIYALWGVLLIMPHALYVSRFLNQYFGWFPLFKVDTDSHAAVVAQSVFDGSPFIAGMIVSMMVIPLACAVMRGVFAQAPLGEREAALALGATRWGMIRSVVLPFGKGGIIGGTMLGLGRALGETVAVLLILGVNFDVRFKPLQQGGITTSSLIANFYGDATSVQISALLAAGFVLFAMTILVNLVAATIVNRSRSGAETEI